VSAFLLDVKVLIALIDPLHTQHDAAHRWFADSGQRSWARCPLTENAVPRIVGQSGYRNSPCSPAPVIAALSQLCRLPGHVFWPDDVSLCDAAKFDHARLLDARQVTDSYLLALAVAHGGRLATFDRRLVADAVRGGRAGCVAADRQLKRLRGRPGAPVAGL
jgi:toxin-antitoxin system PIN domain toxin